MRPATMWAGLIALILISLVSMGYYVGLTSGSRPWIGLGMILCLTITLWLIADLDRPLEGYIRVNHQGMIDVRNSMPDENP